MFAVCNMFTGQGAAALYDRLFDSTAEVETLMRGIPGFVSYTMVRTEEGGYSLVVVENQSDLLKLPRWPAATSSSSVRRSDRSTLR